MKNLKKRYNRIVLGYFIFGICWILFSGKFLHFNVKNLELLEKLEEAKGIVFIFITTIILHLLMKKNYTENSELTSIAKDNEALFKEEEMIRKKIIEIEQQFFDFTIDLFETKEINNEDYIKKIFRLSYDLIEEVDFGSAYIVKKDKVEFIDSLGYNLDTLNKMDRQRSQFEIAHDRIKHIINPEKNIKNKLINHTASEVELLNGIKESVYIGVSISETLEGGIALDISKDSLKTFSTDSLNKLKALQQIINSTYKIKKVNDRFKEFHHDIISSFLAVFEHHDLYTKGHSESVAEISMQIGKKMNLSQDNLNNLYWAGILHDIGKIVVPTHILNKPGRLTDEEFEIIKRHPVVGYEIISKSKSLESVAKYVLSHHERWDGKGYPNGLKEDEIPLISQIISVADSWHAMTSERAYKKVFSQEEAMKEFLLNSGTQFPPEIVNQFYEKKNRSRRITSTVCFIFQKDRDTFHNPIVSYLPLV